MIEHLNTTHENENVLPESCSQNPTLIIHLTK
jgi:hypothetical protein